MGDNMPYFFPEAFAERMKMLLGEAFSAFTSSYSEDSPVSVRLHPLKWKGGLPGDRVPWCSQGYYLGQRPLFTADPWLHGGAYYVQEPSSMFLEQLCRVVWPEKPALVLDLCGAPGGKTTHLMSLLQPGDLLVANEVIRSRARILQENVTKWGIPGVVVTSGDPAAFASLGEIFDLIVVDAPCSGEGLFRKEPRAAEEWSPDHTRLCASRQKRILSEAWKCLRPGGAMVYSTCTFNPDENEENLEWLAQTAGASFLEVVPDPDWGIETSVHGKVTGYRFYPHRLRGEGFFAAVVRKEGYGTAPLTSKGSPRNWSPATRREITTLEPWILPGLAGEFLSDGEITTLFPGEGRPLLALLEKRMPLLQVGIPMASATGAHFIPHPALALSTALHMERFPVAPLSPEEAIRFLRKDPLLLPGREKGWILATFRNLPLGWLKNLGNRTNNYFPQEYRIRMTIPHPPPIWHDPLTRSMME